MFYRLGVSRQMNELLELLFPDGVNYLPRLTHRDAQAFALSILGVGYQNMGQLQQAISIYSRSHEIDLEDGRTDDLCVNLTNLSNAFQLIGKLRDSETFASQAIIHARTIKDLFHEAASLNFLGKTLSVLGIIDSSNLALRRSLRILLELSLSQSVGNVTSDLAQRALWTGNFREASSLANRAWDLAHVNKNESDFIRARRLQGEAVLGLNDLIISNELLHNALTRVRGINEIEEEIPVLLALAELRRRQGDKNVARGLLEDVWEFAERGPYPLFHADALNVLARIERDAGNTGKAVEAATKAYQLAWCDGPPYAYHWGLIKAQKHLEELGAPLPDMPPFDESKYEPMPEVEINPKDEFHHGTNKQEPDPTSKSTTKAGGKRKRK
jgi:tetratricopeptide (TPR) repeat protein